MTLLLKVLASHNGLVSSLRTGSVAIPESLYLKIEGSSLFVSVGVDRQWEHFNFVSSRLTPIGVSPADPRGWRGYTNKAQRAVPLQK